MDREVVEQKLESLQRCLQRIEDKLPPALETLEQDPDLQDVVAANLMGSVHACVGLGADVIAELRASAPHTVSQMFETLAGSGLITGALAVQLTATAELRNVLLHRHEEMDWAGFHTGLRYHLDGFDAFVDVIAIRAAT